jgi:hypothetical protein
MGDFNMCRAARDFIKAEPAKTGLALGDKYLGNPLGAAL